MCAYERKVGDGWERLRKCHSKDEGITHSRTWQERQEGTRAHTHKTTVEQGDPARLMAGALCEMARYRMDLHVALFIRNSSDCETLDIENHPWSDIVLMSST